MASKRPTKQPATASPPAPPVEADAPTGQPPAVPAVAGDQAEGAGDQAEGAGAPAAAPATGVVDKDSALAAAAGNDSLGDMMAVNFLEYASYVIKERAIPDAADGMKPVQRRILHSLWELDDGRFHKVANVIGHTMRYHPHGDASIGSALVVLANKDFFIDRQGNFGNIFTGDEASAPRYIECRLTPLAREVLFNRELTEYVDSYDGRNQEPVVLPAKVPALLMMGADGIAVGMATCIMPHNFGELLKAQIALLKGRRTRLYPDFQTGGLMDVGEYEDGNGRIKVRACIDVVDDKTLVIRDIPATTTTERLMASIVEANRRGKIKIAGINDYTTDRVEIEIKMPRGFYAEECLKQLYAYTDCEVSISCSLTVIHNNRPEVMTVTQVLRDCTDQLVHILERELQIELGKLQDRFHEKTLAQIFIENRVYKRIEECETYEQVLAEVHAGLAPFADQLRRPIIDEDIEKLLQIQIRRISLFDINKNRQELETILEDIEQANYNLEHLVDYAITYLRGLLDRYGKNYPRRTKIEDLETISAKEVALENVKVGHDRVNHFVGREIKNSNKNEELLVCTEFDRLVLLQNDGKYKVVPIPDKLYVGQVKYVMKADKEQVYSMVYRDRKTSKFYAKRFRIASYIMDRDYAALPKGCIIEGLYSNYGVVVRCEFKHRAAGAADYLDLDFNTVELRAAGARGFKISDRPIGNLVQLKRGSQTPDGPSEDEPLPAGVAAPAAAEATADGPPEASQEAVYEPHLDDNFETMEGIPLPGQSLSQKESSDAAGRVARRQAKQTAAKSRPDGGAAAAPADAAAPAAAPAAPAAAGVPAAAGADAPPAPPTAVPPSAASEAETAFAESATPAGPVRPRRPKAVHQPDAAGVPAAAGAAVPPAPPAAVPPSAASEAESAVAESATPAGPVRPRRPKAVHQPDAAGVPAAAGAAAPLAPPAPLAAVPPSAAGEAESAVAEPATPAGAARPRRPKAVPQPAAAGVPAAAGAAVPPAPPAAAPPTPATVAKEWQQRSQRATHLPDEPVEAPAAAEPPPLPAPPSPPPRPTPAPIRRRIDEETPFFLE